LLGVYFAPSLPLQALLFLEVLQLGGPEPRLLLGCRVLLLESFRHAH
jgi:hypothetical protein